MSSGRGNLRAVSASPVSAPAGKPKSRRGRGRPRTSLTNAVDKLGELEMLKILRRKLAAEIDSGGKNAQARAMIFRQFRDVCRDISALEEAQNALDDDDDYEDDAGDFDPSNI